MANALQERYGNLVITRFRELNWLAPLTNRRYEGKPTAGAVQIPVRALETAVSAYNKVTGIALNEPTTTYLTVTIDNDYAVNELIDGYDADAVPDNIVLDRLESASWGLANQAQTDGISILEAGGTTETNTTESVSTTIYDNILASQQALDESNVPRDKRYLAIAPKYLRLLKQDESFIRNSDIAQDMLIRGQVGMVDGLPVFMATGLDANTEFVIFNKEWFYEIDEWKVLPKLVSLDQSVTHVGASSVKGRFIYKHAVGNALAIRVKTFA